MFSGMSSLTSLDLSSFNTATVTDMHSMFQNCKQLTSLDLKMFNTGKVTNMSNMFSSCQSLKNIYVSNDFATTAVSSSDDMFKDCVALPNWNSSNKADVTMAKDASDNGYLTNSDAEVKPWVEYQASTGTLTFHYDKNTYGYTARYDLPTKKTDNLWVTNNEEYLKNITKVVFNEEFKSVSPTTCAGWFLNMSALKEIEGIEYLNTEKVTDMQSMFEGCKALTAIDMSKFNTTEVTDMNSMFKDCNVVADFDVSAFNTEKVTSMASMFENCDSIDKLDLRNFNTAKVTNTGKMFSGCGSLAKIVVSKNFTKDQITSSDNMFYGCTTLPYFTSSAVDKTKATDYTDDQGYFNNIDNGSEAWVEYQESTKTLTFHFDRLKSTTTTTSSYYLPKTGEDAGWNNLFNDNDINKMFSPVTKVVFNKDFEDVRPVTCKKWFYKMAYLTEIDGLKYLNTSEVTDMSYMFAQCMQLTGKLDLSTFNTEKVTTMEHMFGQMGQTTEIDLSSFCTENVTNMNHMFQECGGLTTLDLTPFDTKKLTSAVMMFKDCSRLTNITVNEGFTLDSVVIANDNDASSSMFDNCGNLLNFDSNKTNKVKANDIRLGGYLNNVDLKAAMWAGYQSDTKTLTFYYDDTMKDVVATKKMAFPTDDADPAWLAYASSVETVAFDRSFAEARPTSTAKWFKGFNKLTTIQSLSNFNTSEVTDMSYMFNGCSAMTSLNLSTFNTAKVTTMSQMFHDMSNVTSINLSSFATDSVSSMDHMFDGCSALTKLDLTTFHTSKVDGAEYMFNGCSNLERIVVTDSLRFGEKTTDTNMFAGCNKILNFDSKNVGKEKAQDIRYGGYFNNGDLKAAIWAAYTEDNKTLTFYYNDKMQDLTATKKMILPAIGQEPAWLTYKDQITQITFDNSFAEARPENCYAWFKGMSKLTTLYNLKNLNTSEINDMSYMFNGCSALTDLNLTTFNTDKVTDMDHMFVGMTALKSIRLASLCTDSVTSMEHMFENCKALTELDLTSFNTAKVDSMRYMFNGCSSLKEIIVNDNFALNDSIKSEGMFNGCTSLLNFDSKITDKAKAKDIRLGGYLHNISLNAAMWAAYNGDSKTLTFYYDDKMLETTATKKMSLPAYGETPLWSANKGDITTVTFDQSFEEARPINCARWFEGMSKLTTINQLEYLNTSEVTDMDSLFYGCSSLTSVDLSHFNTAKVESMNSMFRECKAATLNLSTFNTSHVTGMSSMFRDCKSLSSLDVTPLNTDNVTTMESMFQSCEQITALDLRNFNTAKVTNTESMFNGCSKLSDIKVTDLFTVKNITNSQRMFTGCTSLGSYDSNKVDSCMAKDKTLGGYFNNALLGSAAWVEYDSSAKTLTFHYDRDRTACKNTAYDLPTGTSATDVPGWSNIAANITKVLFKNEFMSVRPVTCSRWFMNMSSLEKIDSLDNLNTSDVTDMSYMFNGCTKLDTLDLNTFVTDIVTDMSSMFYGMSALKYVDLASFTTINVQSMASMFDGCTALDSLDLTAFDNKSVTSNALMFNNCQNLKRIYVSDEFTFSKWESSTTNLDNLFTGCKSLRNFDSDSIGNAKVKDIRLGGYLNNVDLKAAMWADYQSDTQTLTFHYDDSMKDSEADKTFAVVTGNEEPLWLANYASQVKIVAFDSTFVNVRPTSTAKWFKGMTKYLTFKNFTYLNTTEITDMSDMFNGCSRLVSLDLSHFNTAKAKNVSHMFDGCSSLSNITATNLFALGSDVTSTDMFNGCVCLPKYNATAVDGNMAKDVTEGGYFYNSNIAAQPWVEFNASKLTLTFHYDKNKYTCKNKVYSLDTIDNMPVWLENSASVIEVDFDESFSQVRPTSCANWFNGMTKLTKIAGYGYSGLGNLHTEEVTDMSGMFAGCERLDNSYIGHILRVLNTDKVTSMAQMFKGCKNITKLEYLNKKNTANVTDMSGMFQDCSSLKTLDLSNFNTAKVTSMASMFAGDKELTSLDLSKFDTQNVTDMSNMFADCQAMTSDTLTSFNTENVTNMENMFLNCAALTDLSVKNFETGKVTSMKGMFSGCSKLTTLDLGNFDLISLRYADEMFKNASALTRISVTNKFNIADVTTHNDVFSGCTSLTNYTTATTWEIKIKDVSKGGYLDNVDVLKPIVEYDATNKTLKFHNDISTDYSAATIYQLPYAGQDPAWLTHSADIEKVEIDAEFIDARPVNCRKWFQGMSKVTTITGIRYMNTNETTDMSYMFDGCSGLTGSLDISSFNTEKVTTMANMFNGCSSLEHINVCEEFITTQVTCSDNMFASCSKLPNWNASNATDKTMASDESSKGYLNFSNIENRAWVEYQNDDNSLTFHYDKLKYASTTVATGKYDLPNTGETPAWQTASECYPTLIKTIKFNSEFIDAHPVTCAKWFYNMKNVQTIEGLEYLNTMEVTDMSDMFNECGQKTLSSLNVSKFNTEKVTTMENMFRYMYLTELDLTSFSTAAVANVAGMFNGIEELQHIYVGEDFDLSNATADDMTFYNCKSLPDFSSTETGLAKANYKDGYLTLRRQFTVGDKAYNVDGYDKDATCNDDVTFTDGEAYKSTFGFTFGSEKTASYERKVSNKWATLCLPFEFSVTENTSCKYYNISGIDDSTLTLTLITSGTVEAGTPVVVNVVGDNSTISISATTAKAVAQSVSADSNVHLQGTFETKTVTDANAYFIAKNKFYAVSDYTTDDKGVKVNPYRAYIVTDKQSGAKYAPVLNIQIDGEATTIDSIVDSLNDDAEYYDANGLRLKTMKRGLNIVKNGSQVRKVIIK